MIVLSSAAQTEVNRLAQQWGLTHGIFRLDVRSGGCRSLTYALRFQAADQPIARDEQVMQGDGWQAIVRTQDVPYLTGLNIDYSEDLVGGNFRFQNPHARNSCSCGHSFDPIEPAP